jgi:integrase
MFAIPNASVRRPCHSFISYRLTTSSPLHSFRGNTKPSSLDRKEIHSIHLTPRRVPMTQKLYEILERLHENRDPDKPWIFWHRYWSRKHGRFVEGPYGDRKKLMKRLCEKAGVRYFRFHPIRHSGASFMDGNGVPLGAIQRILGHENRRTTEIYLHSMRDSEREAMRVFEQARQISPHFSHTDT